MQYCWGTPHLHQWTLRMMIVVLQTLQQKPTWKTTVESDSVLKHWLLTTYLIFLEYKWNTLYMSTKWTYATKPYVTKATVLLLF